MICEDPFPRSCERAASRTTRSPWALLAFVGCGLVPALLGCGQRPDVVEIWRQECASCHAEDGRGESRKLPLSPGLDLHRSDMVQQSARGPIYRVIRQGYGGMPGFDHRLEHEEIDATVTYVINLVRSSTIDANSSQR